MIVRQNLDWRRVAHYTGRQMAVAVGFATAVTIADVGFGATFFRIPAAPLSVLGIALGIFLGFRTGAAYARWWEARTLWGGIINYSRTWARQALSLPGCAVRPPDKRDARTPDALAPTRRALVYNQIAWAQAVRCHLRRQDPTDELRPLLPPEVVAEVTRPGTNTPAALLLRAEYLIARLWDDGLLDSMKFTQMDRTLTELTNLLGGCERIKNTPLPRQYDAFPRVFVLLLCALLPMALVEGAGKITPLLCGLIAFQFIALDTIGRNIEAPFENAINDTPMSALSRTIEINLRQMLGENDLPEPVKPVDGFLY